MATLSELTLVEPVLLMVPVKEGPVATGVGVSSTGGLGSQLANTKHNEIIPENACNVRLMIKPSIV